LQHGLKTSFQICYGGRHLEQRLAVGEVEGDLKSSRTRYDQHNTDVASIDSDSSSSSLPFTTILGYDVTMQVEMEKNVWFYRDLLHKMSGPAHGLVAPEIRVSANTVAADTSTAANNMCLGRYSVARYLHARWQITEWSMLLLKE
jgi:hypothetical protein